MVKFFPAGVLGCLGLCLLVLFPVQSAAGAASGLSLCARVLIPSLFPFLLLSDPVLSRLGGGGRGAHFLLGLVGGYPLGTRHTCRLRAEARISRREALWRLGTFSCPGTGFMCGAVASGLLGRPLLCLPLVALQVLACLAAGLLLRPPPRRARPPLPAAPLSFSEALPRAISSMAGICGCVILCSCLLSAARAVGAALMPSALPPALSVLLMGLCELSCGVQAAAALPLCPATLALISGLCAFGGLCVALQCAPHLRAAGLSLRAYLGRKALQGALASLLAYFFFSLPIFCW